jgi:hypothetical protein
MEVRLGWARQRTLSFLNILLLAACCMLSTTLRSSGDTSLMPTSIVFPWYFSRTSCHATSYAHIFAGNCALLMHSKTWSVLQVPDWMTLAK